MILPPKFILAAISLLTLLSAGVVQGQTIQRSIAFPVTNQTVTFTVPGLGAGGIISITSSQGVTTQLLTDTQERATWTPSRYGKYTISAGATTDTMWVTARQMKFHWWSCTTAQKNVTEVMQRDAAWQARGVNRVDWTGGDYLAAPENGGYTTAQQWYNNWTYAYDTGGMALDEMWCDDVARTNAMLQAISMVRQGRGPAYSINVWSAGFGSNFAAGAANFKANNVTVLIEDYYGGWNNHKSRWDAVRSYGLQHRAISGIWPGTTNLTNEAAIRADVALVRLAEPNANGIAMFAPDARTYTPNNLPTLLNDCDKAIEDYYLKPLIHLSVTSAAQLDVWNLGNDDATGFSLQLLNSSLGVLQTIDLSTLAANGHSYVTWPAGAVYAKVINSPGTANLYVGNSQYSNGLFRLLVPGRYTFTNANGDSLWSTFSSWDPHGPPPGNIDSGNSAYFDSNFPVSVTAASGETSISSIQFATAGWTINGNPTSQDFFTYGINSAGAGTNTIKIGYRTSAGVSASFNVGSGNTLAMDGRVSGPDGLVKQGAGTLKLSWANTYTGTTSINAGTLALSGGVALPDTGAVVLANAADAQLLLNANETIGSLAGGGVTGGNVALQGNTLTVGNAANTSFAGKISGTGGLTKAASGTLTLGGANTYSGNTSVNAGTLSVTCTFFHDQSRVSVSTGAVLNLNTANSDTVGSLVLGGVTVPAGTYNSSHPTYGSYFTGSGSLIVGSAYDSWTASKGLTGANALPNADPDKDGIPNSIEFVLGDEPNPANPGSTSSPLQPTLQDTPTRVVFTFRRSDAANATPGIAIGAEHSSNLTDWTTAVHGVDGVTVTETNDGFGAGVDQVDVSIPKSVTSGSELFVRLKVTVP